MIKLRINDKDYEVKTEWKEFLFEDYSRLISSIDKPLNERISIASGIPLEVVNKLTITQTRFVSEVLSFTDEPENAFLFANSYTDDLNIGKRTYKDLEQSLIFIRKAVKPVAAFDKVVEVYYGEDISKQNIVDCLGKGAHVVGLINKFLTEFKRLGEYELSMEEIEAGVEDLSKFGFFATVVQFARKYGKTHDEILNMPAREVYTTLLYDFEQSVIEKNLMNIRTRNAKK